MKEYECAKRLAMVAGICALSLVGTTNAQVTITEIQQQEFPAVYTPDRTGRITMSWDGSIRSSTGVDLFGGFYSSAEFQLQSDTGQPIDIDIIPNQDIPGVTLSIVETRYLNKTYKKIPMVGVANPGSGTSLYIGMQLDVEPGVAPELIKPSFTVTVTEN